MKISRPSHATVVAYLALFVALGGTAVAVRNEVGAKEVDDFVLRQKATPVSASTIPAAGGATVYCKKNEQFIAGAGGWAGGDFSPTVRRALFAQKRVDGPARGFSVSGIKPPGPANEFVAQALCLRK